MFKKFRKNLLKLVLIIFSLYLFVLVFLYFYQRNLLYHPKENSSHPIEKIGKELTGFTLYIFTIYGAIYGYFLFEEKLENYHLIGTVLVFIGVYLAKKKNVQKI